MTLYELNKQGYKQLPDLGEQELSIIADNVTAFLKKDKSKWYMLLSNEKRDFTLFDDTRQLYDKLAMEVIDILKSRGRLKGIDIRESDIDFWIEIDGEVFLYKLFSYDWGIIKI